jgi:hypothetical protein
MTLPGRSILAAVGQAFDASGKRRPGPPPVSYGLAGASRDRSTLLRVLLTDPDPELRQGAAESLAAAAPGTPHSAIGRALADPDDRVRAAVVHLAAAEGQSSAPLILPLAADRRWPLCQLAALEAAPKFASALTEEALKSFCTAIGRMDPPPFGAEAEALRTIARAVGGKRLDLMLTAGGGRGLGAARLLLAEGSQGSLRALARLSEAHSPELRRLSTAATNLLRLSAPEGAPGETPAEADEVLPDDLIASLAGSLDDPDDTVRGRAIAGLHSVPTEMVAGWAQRALSEGTAAGGGPAPPPPPGG